MSHTKSVVGVSVGDEWPRQRNDLRWETVVGSHHTRPRGNNVQSVEGVEAAVGSWERLL